MNFSLNGLSRLLRSETDPPLASRSISVPCCNIKLRLRTHRCEHTYTMISSVRKPKLKWRPIYWMYVTSTIVIVFQFRFQFRTESRRIGIALAKMAPKRKFSRSEEDQLIEFVKSHPLLYDRHHPEYRNIESRDKAWKQCAKKMNINSECLVMLCSHFPKWFHSTHCSQNMHTAMVQHARLL